MLPLNPFAIRALGAVAVAAVAFGGGYWIRHTGYLACERDHRAALAESLQRGIEQAQEIARQDAEVSEYYERWRTREVNRWHVQVEEVTRDISIDCTRCGLNPDGLRALNDIRKPGPFATDPGQPPGGVPAPDAAPERPAPGTRSLPGPGQPHVQRLRHET